MRVQALGHAAAQRETSSDPCSGCSGPDSARRCSVPPVVAVVTDVERHGVPVVGFGFNSNGRYAAQGILRERFIPRLLEAAPADAAQGDLSFISHGELRLTELKQMLLQLQIQIIYLLLE